MTSSVRIPIEESSQSAEARRTAVRMASDLGFNEIRAGEVAIVVTEACTNILKHAGRGEVLLRVSESGSDLMLELLALDPGPGIRNIAESLRDGYTTGSTPGLGMGAIQRLAGDSDFYSIPGEGTAVLARWPAASENCPGLRVGAVSVCKPGQEVCGDSWWIRADATKSRR